MSYTVWKNKSLWQVEQTTPAKNPLGESLSIVQRFKTKTQALEALERNCALNARLLNQSTEFAVYKGNGSFDYCGVYAFDMGESS